MECCATVRQLHVALHPGRNSSLLEHWHDNKRDVPTHHVSVDFLEEVEYIHKGTHFQHEHAFVRTLAACGHCLALVDILRSPEYHFSYLRIPHNFVFDIEDASTSNRLFLAPEFTTGHQHLLSGSGWTAAARCK
jgi:hypothetical protein